MKSRSELSRRTFTALVGFSAALFGTIVQAGPVQLKNCTSSVVTEVFQSCPGGEGGAPTACGSKQTVWGTVTANLVVDSVKKSASATLDFTPVSGNVVMEKTICALGPDNWMECTTANSVSSQLGRLTIAFNIDGIAPGVYFADIFADITNVPVGGFQNTRMACNH